MIYLKLGSQREINKRYFSYLHVDSENSSLTICKKQNFNH